MSGVGYKRTSSRPKLRSVLPPTPDILAAGPASNLCHQPDPGPALGAWHCRETRRSLLTGRLAGDSEPALRAPVATLEETSSAPSPRHPAVAYCEGTPLRNEIETRDTSLLNHVTDRATEAIAARFGDGPVVGKIRGHIMAASY